MRWTTFRRAALALAGLWIAAGSSLAAQAEGRTVTGVIRDSLTGAPVAGAELTAGLTRVVTDATGRFRLVVGSDSTAIVIRRMGYAPRRLAAGRVGEVTLLAPEPVLLTTLTSTAAAPVTIASGTALGLTSVGEDALAPRGEVSLAGALAVEGVSSQQPGTWGGKAFVRGLGGERVTVLLDGDRVNRACNFGMDGSLATIQPGTVERVEILAGPGSVLYGSGNLGGVINVVTRGSDEDRATGGELRAGASSAVPGGTLGGSWFWNHDALRVALAADGAAYGDYSTPDGTVARSSYRDATLDGRVAVLPSATHRVELHVQRYAGRDIGYPAMMGTSIPAEDRLLTALEFGYQGRRGIMDGASAKVYRQGLDHDMRMAMTMTGMNNMPMTTRTAARTHSVTYGGRGQLRLVPLSALRVDAGAELTEWNADGTRWITRGANTPAPTLLTFQSWPDVRVLDIGAFAQGELRVSSAVSVNGGARLDRIVNRADGGLTTHDWVPTGNVGLRLFPLEGVVVRTSLGYGYRVPDPTELYGIAPRPDGFLYIGRAGLGTETNRNLELAVGYAAGPLDAGVTVYRNELHDLITPVLLADSMISGYKVRQYTNLTRARIDGVTGRLGLALPGGFGLHGVASYTRGENRSTGAPLATIPPVEGTASLRYTRARLLQWAEVEVQGTARQDRPATTAGEVATPGFVVVNARVMFSLARTDLTLGVDNIGDRAYRRHLDPLLLRRPGRNLYLRVRRGL